MKTFFISDLHFDHKNLAIARGFKNEKIMNDFIIMNWNNTVHKKDRIFILGDISMEKSNCYNLIKTLPGIKTVILGNHDKPSHVKELLKVVHSVAGLMNFREYWLSHAPIHPEELRGRKNIHGHVHNLSIDDDRYINVSCENINYTPISYEQIKKTLINY